MIKTLEDAAAIDLLKLSAFEKKQIDRALAKRTRYRYVQPMVRPLAEGVLIESPCCSRRLDSAGGMVDIALLQHMSGGGWRLLSKDHSAAAWKMHSRHERLVDLLEVLREDPEHIFWQ